MFLHAATAAGRRQDRSLNVRLSPNGGAKADVAGVKLPARTGLKHRSGASFIRSLGHYRPLSASGFHSAGFAPEDGAARPTLYDASSNRFDCLTLLRKAETF